MSESGHVQGSSLWLKCLGDFGSLIDGYMDGCEYAWVARLCV